MWQPEPTEGRPPARGLADHRALQALLEEVSRSRRRAAQLANEASGGVTPLDLLAARRTALRALEDYSAALSLRGWPTPPKLVREMQLLRTLSTSRKRRFFDS
jgi:hypothetical protein